MADDAGQSEPDGFVARQADLVWRKGNLGVAASPEARKILREEGVDAWRAWVAEQQAKEKE
jgi:hypothetical protein